MALHRDLTGADLHEPKGADSAAAGDVYVFNGSGSGTAKKIGLNSLDLTSIQDPNSIYLTTTLEDISNPSIVIVPTLEKATFDSAVCILGGAITTSPATISFNRNGIDSTGTPLTIPDSGSSEGVSFTYTPTNNRDLLPGHYIKILSDGLTTGSVKLYITLKFTRTF